MFIPFGYHWRINILLPYGYLTYKFQFLFFLSNIYRLRKSIAVTPSPTDKAYGPQDETSESETSEYESFSEEEQEEEEDEEPVKVCFIVRILDALVNGVCALPFWFVPDCIP